MFGRHKWEPAIGTIVDVRQVGSGTNSSGNGMSVCHEYVVDLQVDGLAPFRIKVEEPSIATNFWNPRIGTRVRFHYDRERNKAKFDKDDPAIDFRAQMKAKSAAFDRNLTQPPSTPADLGPFAFSRPGTGTQVVGISPDQLGMSPEQLRQLITGALANAQVVRLEPPTQ